MKLLSAARVSRGSNEGYKRILPEMLENSKGFFQPLDTFTYDFSLYHHGEFSSCLLCAGFFGRAGSQNTAGM